MSEKKTEPKQDDPEQSKRFLEAAREAGADETKAGADSVTRLFGLLLCFVAIPLGLWSTYLWFANDSPNKGIFIIPMAIVCLGVLVWSGSNRDDPPQAP